MGSKPTAIWKPAWYELDQPLTVGAIGAFYLLMAEEPWRFATGLFDDDKPQRIVKARILSINHPQLGPIHRIDARDLSYRFYAADDTFVQIEAEESPGLIEQGNGAGAYLQDPEFRVELEILSFVE